MAARPHLHTWLWPALTAAAGALLGVVAVINPLIALGAALAMAFVALTVADLAVGVALFTFLSFLEVLPGVGGLSAAKLAGGVLVLSWIAASATTARTHQRFGQAQPAAAILGVAFVAWVLIGVLWAGSSGAVFTALSRYIPDLLLLPIIYTAVNSPRDLRLILLAFVLGVLVSTAYGAFIAPGDPDAAAEGRITGAGVDPNYLAVSLMAGLVVCSGVVLTRAYSGAARVAGLGAVGLLFFALVVTASRTGIVGLIGACVCAVFMAGKGRRLPAAALISIVLLAGAGYITQVAPLEARERLQRVDSGSGRTDIWTVGLRMAKANPVEGVGAGNFPLDSVRYLLAPGTLRRDDLIVNTPKVAHNLYLEAWAELGLVGAGLLLAFFGFAIRAGVLAAREFQRAGNRAMEVLSRSAVVATAGVLTASLFVSYEYEKPLWIVLALGPALLKLSRRTPGPATV